MSAGFATIYGRMKKSKKRQSVASKDLQDSIEELEDRIEKVNSFKTIFFQGILTGLGSVIGATIVFAILISLLSWFIANTEIMWVNNAIEALGLSGMFNK